MSQKYRSAGATAPTCRMLRHPNDAEAGFDERGPQIKASIWFAPLRQLRHVGALLMTITPAFADPLSTINALRAEGCVGANPAGTVVAPSESLNDVARELAGVGQLKDAIERTGYPAADSVAVYLKGPATDAAIRQIIGDDYCTAINNPQLNEVGIYRSGDEMWIVLATRMELPAVEDAAAVAERVLELVNAARADSRQCGNRQFDAAPPLMLSPVLTGVASLHAQDMASQRSMVHRGTDGSQPAERVSRAGYDWRATGENIAAGQENADAVVAGWLDSPEHCANIMAPQFREMGVAFTVVPGNPAIYWAQVFAAPR